MVSSPGLAFSSLSSGSDDLETASLCNGEQLCQRLTWEGPQVHGVRLTSQPLPSLSSLSRARARAGDLSWMSGGWGEGEAVS